MFAEPAISPDGTEVWFLEHGRINIVTLENRRTGQLSVTAELDTDFSRDKLVMLDGASQFLRDNFADSTMIGAEHERTGRLRVTSPRPLSPPRWSGGSRWAPAWCP